jgi:hypothetical protein
LSFTPWAGRGVRRRLEIWCLWTGQWESFLRGYGDGRRFLAFGEDPIEVVLQTIRGIEWAVSSLQELIGDPTTNEGNR